MGEADGYGVGGILGGFVLEVQEPRHHKDDLVFFRPPMTDDGGLDLGRGVGVGVDLEAAKGGEQDTATLRQGEPRPRVAARERRLHSCAIGPEPFQRGDEASFEIGETRSATGALGPDDTALLELVSIAARDNQRPAGGR